MTQSESPFPLPPCLPIFDIGGAVVLPRATLPLRLFEPKYIALMDHALGQPGRFVGVVQPNADGLYSIGTAARITHFSEDEDGEYYISLTGVQRFVVVAPREDDAPFLSAHINASPYQADLVYDPYDAFDRAGFVALASDYLHMLGRAWDPGEIEDMPPEYLINSFNMFGAFSREETQALLEAPTLRARHDMLMMLMRFAIEADQKGQGPVQ